MKDSKPLRLVPPPAPQKKPRKKRTTHAAPPPPPIEPALSKSDFLRWEISTKDTIDFKKIYVDICEGNLVAGLILSQILFWELPDKYGNPKQRVERDGKLWIAKKRSDWWDECRVTPKQLDGAMPILTRICVEKQTYKFDGDPQLHVRLVWENFLVHLEHQLQQIEVGGAAVEIDHKGNTSLTKRELRNSQKGKVVIPEMSKSTTQNTAQTTTKTTASTPSVVDDDVLNLIQNVIDAGVTPSRARKLVPLHPNEFRRRLEYLPHTNAPKAPGAYLCANIETPWNEPPALARKLQAEMLEAHQAAQQRAAQQRAAQSAADRQRAERENDELDLWFKQLPAADRAQIEDQARRRVAPLVAAGANVAGALAAERRNIIRKELQMSLEVTDDEAL